ncbi:MAG: chemotaxis protein CheW [Thermoleophilia bacterium]|nr:chemotaxis protein CheW [Thermoleophilia bacterium]
MHKSTAELEPVIVAEVAGAWYGIPSSAVRHIEMVGTITPVPNTPDFVEGITFSRGQAIPVINLRSCFGHERAAFSPRNRILVVEHENRLVGLLVDSAREFVRLSEEEILPAPEHLDQVSGGLLNQVAKLKDRLILILSVEQLLAGTARTDHWLKTAVEAAHNEVIHLEQPTPARQDDSPKRPRPSRRGRT